MWWQSLSAFQIILALISATFVVVAIVRFFRREKGQSLFKLLALVTIWGSVLIFSLFPSIPRQVSARLGLGENLNTLIFFGFVIIFLIQFKLLNIIERIERNISEMVRKEALQHLKKEKK